MNHTGEIEGRDVESSIVHADDVRESFKLGFEAVKHLTTLSAGSFVLIGTFLDSIFPNRLVKDDKVLIALSFLCFAVSLVISVYSLWRLATMVRSRRPYERKKPKIRLYIAAPSLFYVFGLSFFGTAVLGNVFFGAGKAARTSLERSSQWGPLGAFLIVVMLVFIGRYVLSSLRDKDSQYKIVYPSAEDCKELQGPPQRRTDSAVIRWGGLAAMAAGMVWGVSGLLAVVYGGAHAPGTLAFYLVISISFVALVLTVFGILGLQAWHKRNDLRIVRVSNYPPFNYPFIAARIVRVGNYTFITVLLGQVLGAVVLWGVVGSPVAKALGLYGVNMLFGLLWLALGYLGTYYSPKAALPPPPQ